MLKCDIEKNISCFSFISDSTEGFSLSLNGLQDEFVPLSILLMYRLQNVVFLYILVSCSVVIVFFLVTAH